MTRANQDEIQNELDLFMHRNNLDIKVDVLFGENKCCYFRGRTLVDQIFWETIQN